MYKEEIINLLKYWTSKPLRKILSFIMTKETGLLLKGRKDLSLNCPKPWNMKPYLDLSRNFGSLNENGSNHWNWMRVKFDKENDRTKRHWPYLYVSPQPTKNYDKIFWNTAPYLRVIQTMVTMITLTDSLNTHVPGMRVVNLCKYTKDRSSWHLLSTERTLLTSCKWL